MSKNVNALQKLKSYINPEQLTFTGSVVQMVSSRECKVEPLGSSGGVVTCQTNEVYQIGQRVKVQGTTVISTAPPAGVIEFIEV